MRGIAKRCAALLKALFFKKVKSENRLIYNVTGLLIVVLLHFFISIGLLLFTHHTITSFNNQLQTDLKLIETVKKDLTSLSLREDFSTASLQRLFDTINLLSAATRSEPQWESVFLGFSSFLKAAADHEGALSNREVEAGLNDLRVLIDELAAALNQKRQDNNTILSSRAIIYETSGVLAVLALVFIGMIFLIRNLKKQETELAYFENIAYRFKGGQLDKIDFNYQGRILSELNQVIFEYITLIKERYQAVKDHIKSLNFQTNEIALFSKQNTAFHTKIKQDLEQIIADTYRRVDHYQELAERIKALDLDLEDSQGKIFELHESLESWNGLFRETPETISRIGDQVKKREQYLKKVVGDLYQLRTILDRLLQTGSIFQNVAEQNSLLALNASIEAARAETAAGGFDIAALQIAELAEKVNRVSKELLAIVDMMRVKGNIALKSLESDLARNNEVKHFIEAISNKINLFCHNTSRLLEQVIQYSSQTKELDDRRQSLKNLISNLGDLNQKAHHNYGKAEAAFEVIKKSGENLTVTEQLDALIIELKHLMNKIVV